MGSIGAIFSFLAGMVDIVKSIMGFNRDQAIKQTGIDAQRGQDLEAQNKVLKDELKAQTNAPQDVADVINIARKGDL
jgi:hypothetical protein